MATGADRIYGFVPVPLHAALAAIDVPWRTQLAVAEALHAATDALAGADRDGARGGDGGTDCGAVARHLPEIAELLRPLVESKHYQVVGETLDLVAALVARLGHTIRPAVPSVVGLVAPRLADSQALLRQRAFHALLHVQRYAGPHAVLAHLVPTFAGQNARYQEEVFNFMIQALLLPASASTSSSGSPASASPALSSPSSAHRTTTTATATATVRAMFDTFVDLVGFWKGRTRHVMCDLFAVFAAQLGRDLCFDAVHAHPAIARAEAHEMGLRLLDPRLPQRDAHGYPTTPAAAIAAGRRVPARRAGPAPTAAATAAAAVDDNEDDALAVLQQLHRRHCREIGDEIGAESTLARSVSSTTASTTQASATPRGHSGMTTATTGSGTPARRGHPIQRKSSALPWDTGCSTAMATAAGVRFPAPRAASPNTRSASTSAATCVPTPSSAASASSSASCARHVASPPGFMSTLATPATPAAAVLSRPDSASVVAHTPSGGPSPARPVSRAIRPMPAAALEQLWALPIEMSASVSDAVSSASGGSRTAPTTPRSLMTTSPARRSIQRSPTTKARLLTMTRTDDGGRGSEGDRPRDRHSDRHSGSDIASDSDNDHSREALVRDAWSPSSTQARTPAVAKSASDLAFDALYHSDFDLTGTPAGAIESPATPPTALVSPRVSRRTVGHAGPLHAAATAPSTGEAGRATPPPARASAPAVRGTGARARATTPAKLAAANTSPPGPAARSSVFVLSTVREDLATMQSTTADWEAKVRAIDRMAATMVPANASKLAPLCHELTLATVAEMGGLRSKQAKSATVLMGRLVQTLPAQLEPEIEHVMGGLFRKAADGSVFIQTQVDAALTAAVAALGPIAAPRLLTALLNNRHQKHTGVRQRVAALLAETLRHMTPTQLAKVVSPTPSADSERLFQTLYAYLRDGLAATRRHARAGFAVLAGQPPFSKCLVLRLTPPQAADVAAMLRAPPPKDE